MANRTDDPYFHGKRVTKVRYAGPTERLLTPGQLGSTYRLLPSASCSNTRRTAGTGKRHRARGQLLRSQCRSHALSAVPRARAVRGFRRDRGGLQNAHRRPPETLRNVLDRSRRQRRSSPFVAVVTAGNSTTIGSPAGYDYPFCVAHPYLILTKQGCAGVCGLLEVR